MKLKTAIKNNKLLYFVLYPAISVYRNYKGRKFLKEHNKLHKLLQTAKAGTLTFNVPDFKGDFEINIHSDLTCRLLLQKSYEGKTVTILENYIDPNKDIIDVGANIGFFAVYFAKSLNENRKVLAIEPTPGAFALLKNNILKNNCASKVNIFNGVASNHIGELTINVVPGMEEYSSIGKLEHPAVKKTEGTAFTVPSETLDSLITKYKLEPGLIKIDVEGAEYLVLQGGQEIIKKYFPTFLIEVSDHLSKSLQTTSSMVFKFLTDLGYDIRPVDGSSSIMYDNQFNGDILAVKKKIV